MPFMLPQNKNHGHSLLHLLCSLRGEIVNLMKPLPKCEKSIKSIKLMYFQACMRRTKHIVYSNDDQRKVYKNCIF